LFLGGAREGDSAGQLPIVDRVSWYVASQYLFTIHVFPTTLQERNEIPEMLVLVSVEVTGAIEPQPDDSREYIACP
jgi:hypothetical protein